MRPITPVIIAYKKTVIDAEFKSFLKQYNPLGLILMQENCHNPKQLQTFITDFRDCVGREDAPISIDQEGGKGQNLSGRLLFDKDQQVVETHPGSEHWPYFPPVSLLGQLYQQDSEFAGKVSYQMGRALGSVLADSGIDLNNAPVIDLPIANADLVIGNRAFSNDANSTILLARQYSDGLHSFGVKSCIKHVPGHGRAMVDSHQSLPIVKAGLDDLRQSDFIPVKAFADAPWAMVAHILFTAIDSKFPATQSTIIINNVLREELGYTGVICSDCIWMKSLKGSLPERASLCQKAGIDVIFAVHGKLSEQAAIMDALNPASDLVLERLGQANRKVQNVKEKSKSSSLNWQKEFNLFKAMIEKAGFNIDYSQHRKVGQQP